MNIGVYSPNWVGDAVMALPFIQQLQDQYPDGKITIVCKYSVASVFHHHPAAGRSIALPQSNTSGFLSARSTGKSLLSLHLDVFYTLTDSFRSAAILWWSGAEQRIGYSTQLRSILLTSAVELTAKRMHRSLKYLALINPESNSEKIPQIYLTNDEVAWAKKELAVLELKQPIALCPFSVAGSRTIPNSSLKKWLHGSEENYILFGSERDTDRALALINECNDISIISVCGKYSLRKSIALIALCKYALAADSGLGHISAALDIPTVSFFGAGLSTMTRPLGARTTIVNNNVHCSPCRKNICCNEEEPLLCLQQISRSDVEIAVRNLSLNP